MRILVAKISAPLRPSRAAPWATPHGNPQGGPVVQPPWLSGAVTAADAHAGLISGILRAVPGSVHRGPARMRASAQLWLER